MIDIFRMKMNNSLCMIPVHFHTIKYSLFVLLGLAVSCDYKSDNLNLFFTTPAYF
jgi:hypothetical protein